MQLTPFLVTTLNAVSYSLLLFLLAAGLSLILGLMGVVNLAHGSFYMLGAYIGLTVMWQSGNFILAALAGGLAAAAIGFCFERYFLQPLHKKELDQVLLTFGFTYIFADIIRWIWGGNPQVIPKPPILSGSLSILEVSFPVYRVAVIIIGVVVAILLWFAIEKTKVGAIIRAGVDDKEMVMVLGININTIFAIVVTGAAFLAGLSGVIGGPILGVYLGLDFEILVLSLVVIVVGGLGSLKGVFVGSLLIGFLDTFGKMLFPRFAIFTIYVAMAAVLLLKPTGFVGKEVD